VVLQRLYEKNQSSDLGPRAIEDAVAIDPEKTPLLAQVTRIGHRIGAPDETNFEYGLTCILDHASRLIDESNGAKGKAGASRQRKTSTARGRSKAPANR
jgi:hypothetical protein